MNIPDDFVFVCEDDGEELIASNVVTISTHINHVESYIALRSSEAFVIINIDHGHDSYTQLKKGTKEFNELLQLAYMRSVIG